MLWAESYGQRVCTVLHWPGLNSLQSLAQRPAAKLPSSQGHKKMPLRFKSTSITANT